MKKIVVASKNPVKLDATQESFMRMFPDEAFEIVGVSVGSGVADQPSTDGETYDGAFNRAKNARAAMPDADFWVGLEGGIEEKKHDMEAFAWMIVIAKDGRVGKGRTATFFLPSQVAELIRQGKELGEADDIVFKKENSKQANGAVGLLTHDVLTRRTHYIQGMVFALVPFKNPELYPLP